MSPPRTDAAATWLLAAMALIAMAFAASVSAGSDGVDFYQFWVVGQTARETPGRDVYADAERARLGAEWLERIERDAGGKPSKLVAVARYRNVTLDLERIGLLISYLVSIRSVWRDGSFAAASGSVTRSASRAWHRHAGLSAVAAASAPAVHSPAR